MCWNTVGMFMTVVNQGIKKLLNDKMFDWLTISKQRFKYFG